MSSPSPPDRPRRRLRLRAVLAVFGVLVPLVPIAVALSLTGGSTPSSASTGSGAPLHLSVAAPATKTRAPATPGPKAPMLNLLVPPGRGALVAVVTHPTALRSRPGAHGRTLARLGARTSYGSPATLWVARISGRWLGVVTPQAGNNHLGWIQASAASLTRSNWELKVTLAAHRLTVLHGGRIVHRYTIAIGAPANPTPIGRFAVTDRLRTGDPAGPYGCCILALSAVAPHAIQDWSGGNRIAIHSTPETWSIGESVSHGCMRLTLAEGRWLIAHIPLGTPTLVSA